MTPLHFFLAALVLLFAAGALVLSRRIRSPRRRLALRIALVVATAVVMLLAVAVLGAGPSLPRV
ncbi:MAG: hypothetical protein ACOCVP_00155 [Wenzhouxiangella sp.]